MGAADYFTSYQAASHAVFMLPAFRWALLTPMLPASSQSTGSHRGILPITQLLEFLTVDGHMLTSTISFWLFFFFSFLPSSNPLIIFPLESILQLLRDLCSHVACLSLCLLSPVSQSTQGCHGHQDTISMPLVSWLGDGVITHLQYDLKKSFGTGDQGLKTLLHSHWNHYPEELKMEICQEKHHSGGLKMKPQTWLSPFKGCCFQLIF